MDGVAYDVHSVSRVVFGRGQFGRLGELAGGLGRSALVVVSTGGSGGGTRLAQLEDMLTAAGLRSVSVRQQGEPTVADVDAAVSLARSEGCDMVIALGGGSAIDAGKAAAGLLTNGGGALDYMEVVGKGRKITKPAAPWIAVPTTAGTGAEATRNAVIASREKHFKASLRSEHLLARVALVDPELTVTCPPPVTAAAGMDALCQLIEAYTSTGANAWTDPIALAGIGEAGRCLLRAYRDGTDLEAREGMSKAALLSGIALSNAGLGAVHGLAAPLGASFPIPHGVVCAALLPHVMAANVRALRAQRPQPPALLRYVGVACALSNKGGADSQAAIDQGIEWVAQLARDLNIPPLGSFGLKPADVPAIAALAAKSSSMRYNPVPLSEGVLAEVLTKAL
jgi:alcohol dehydrogenase class IV